MSSSKKSDEEKEEATKPTPRSRQPNSNWSRKLNVVQQEARLGEGGHAPNHSQRGSLSPSVSQSFGLSVSQSLSLSVSQSLSLPVSQSLSLSVSQSLSLSASESLSLSVSQPLSHPVSSCLALLRLDRCHRLSKENSVHTRVHTQVWTGKEAFRVLHTCDP